jgi:tyrosinase
MYLYFFDRILRAAAGDPSLVLPYWNWTDPGQRTLPLAFRQPADPSNSLYIAAPGRPQTLNDGTAGLGAGTVDYSVAFADTDFDSPTGSGASFGGQIASSPMQFNAPHGEFESQPHDVVHVALGGLMDDPDTAAEDPIFWLHHANIDRMWNRWIGQGGRVDATDAKWLDTQFTFYDEAGHAVYLTGAEIVNTVGQLNYRYDDDPLRLHWRFPITLVTAILRLQPAPPPPPPFVPVGQVTAGAAPAAPGELRAAEKAAAPQLRSLAESAPSGKERTELAGVSKRLALPLSEQALSRLRELSERPAPRQVWLRFDDIRYDKSNGVYYEVYLNPSPSEKLDVQSPAYVGNLALFGLKPHAMAGQAAAPTKIFVDYDISHQVRAALTANSKSWTVVLVPRGLFDAKGEPLPVPKETQGTVGRVQILSR